MAVKVCCSHRDLLWGAGCWGSALLWRCVAVTPRTGPLCASAAVCCLSPQFAMNLQVLRLAARVANKEGFWNHLHESSASLRLEKRDAIFRCVLYMPYLQIALIFVNAVTLQCQEAATTLCSDNICIQVQPRVQQGRLDVRLLLGPVYFCDMSASAWSDYRRQEKACSAWSSASFAAASL